MLCTFILRYKVLVTFKSYQNKYPSLGPWLGHWQHLPCGRNHTGRPGRIWNRHQEDHVLRWNPHCGTVCDETQNVTLCCGTYQVF